MKGLVIKAIIFAEKLNMSKAYSLHIKDIQRATEKAVKIIFDVPQSLQQEFTFQPGQYLNLETTIDGETVRRSYSICSSPSEELAVAVKELEGGVFSTYANRTLKTGDTLAVFPPEGNFLLQPAGNADTYCAFAAGSGITPILSMINQVLKEGKNKFVLVYGNRSPEETMFLEDLLSLQKQYPERLFVEYIYSRKQAEGATFGRIERATINYVLKNKYAGVGFAQFLLCGPEEMINHAQEVLLENEVKEEQIAFELFHSTEEGEDVAKEGFSEIEICVDDESYTFSMNQQDVILDAALEKDIDAPYSCQGGICSSCVAKVVEGKAKMRKNQILTDEEVEEGLILTCQAHPISNRIVIDYDDV